MKKTTLGLLMVLLGVYTASARQITPDEAMSVASDFMSSSELKSSMAVNSSLRPIKAPGLDANASVSPYYIFNRGENEGFVIISGDDRAPKILGYSDKGSFNVENLPPQLKAMMECWTKQMSQLPISAIQHASWNNTTSTRTGEEILMETAEWGQYAPFNDLCPTIDGQKAPAGCVATAMAIAMKYHNWPDCTRGGMEYDYYCPDETFDFDSYSINWDALADKENPNFANQAARLTYSAGIAAQMMYGPSESAADFWAVDHAFIYFYTYGKECQFIPRNKFNENEWNNILRDQLKEVGPVVYSGFGSGGHTFVIDGYNADGLYHVNWGWDGLLNGYYTLEFSLDNGMSFGDGHGMVINLTPDRTKTQYSKAWISNADVFGSADNDDWNFLNPKIVEGVPNTFKSPDICIANFRGYVRIAIADEDDKIVVWADDMVHQKDGYRYNCPHPGGYIMGENMTLRPLQIGQRYQLYSQEVANGPDGTDDDYKPYPPSEDPADWQMVVGGMIRPSCFFAEGNHSRVTETRIHISEDLPAYFGTFNSFDKEFSIRRLRGFDCPLSLHLPKKNVRMEMESFDNDGTQHEVAYIDWGSEDDPSYLGLNISLLADQIDVYFKYEDDGDTRRDKDVAADQIVEDEGLIYKIKEDKLELIGYDKIGENVSIPKIISVNSQEMPVRYVADEALAFSPIKHLEINPDTLEMGRFSFAGMSQLEVVSLKDLCLMSDTYKRFGFINSNLKTVYLDAAPKDHGIFYYSTGILCENIYPEDIMSVAIGVKDLDYVVTVPPENGYDWTYFVGLQYFKDMLPIEEKRAIFNSYIVPGLGNTDILSIKDELPFNILQMWNYEIDRENCIVRLDNILTNVNIESVFINGVEAVADTGGSYIDCSNTDPTGGIDVKVSYAVNGLKKTTHYTPKYNETVESTDLSGIESTFIDSDIIDVYGVNGMLVKKNIDREGLKTLTPGIYLICQGGEKKKLVIR